MPFLLTYLFKCTILNDWYITKIKMNQYRFQFSKVDREREREIYRNSDSCIFAKRMIENHSERIRRITRHLWHDIRGIHNRDCNKQGFSTKFRQAIGCRNFVENRWFYNGQDWDVEILSKISDFTMDKNDMSKFCRKSLILQWTFGLGLGSIVKSEIFDKISTSQCCIL